jgi:hypothetical protein
MNESGDPIPDVAGVDPLGVDPLDRLLTMSLSARPEAQPIENLAERAIERAQILDRVAEQQRRRLVIHRWRLRIVYGAAVALIGALILIGGNRLMKQRQALASTDDSTASTSTSDSTTASTGTTVLWLGGLVFICALAGLAAESAVAPNRASILA